MIKQNKQSGFSAIEIGIIVVVVGIIGALGWKFYDAATNKSAVSNASELSTVDITPSALTDLKDVAEIQAAALTDKPGVTVIHIELEQNSDGILVYKAQLSNGTVTVHNARTGAHVKSTTSAEKSDETLPADFTSGVGFAKALEIARAEKPTSKVYKIELELEGGVVVYSVRFTDQARVDVKASDGTIVRTKAAKIENSSTPATKESANSGSRTKAGDDRSGSGSTSTDAHNEAHHTMSGDDGLSHSDDDDASDDSDDSSHGGESEDSDNSGSGKSR